MSNMFIVDGKWNYPLWKVLTGEIKATPLVIAKLLFAAMLGKTIITVIVVNAYLFAFSPENFPAPITKRVISFIVE